MMGKNAAVIVVIMVLRQDKIATFDCAILSYM